MSPIRLLYVVALLAELAAVAFGQPPVAPPVADPVPTVAVAPAAPAYCVCVKREEPGGYAHGGGTVIGSEGGRSVVLTNAHVARDAAMPLTVTVGGYEYRAKYLGGSRVYDIGSGLIRIDGPDLALLEVGYELAEAPVALTAPAVGSRVRQWGYAGRQYNQGPAYKEGTVLGEWGNDLLTTLSCDHGDSGAGLLNDHDELVAVCHGKPPVNQPAGQVRQYAVRTEVVTVYLERDTPRLFGRLRDRLAARRLARELVRPPVRVEPDPAPQQAPKVEPKPVPKAVPPVVVAPQPAPPVVYYYSYQYDPRVWGYQRVQYAAPPCVNGQCPRR